MRVSAIPTKLANPTLAGFSKDIQDKIANGIARAYSDGTARHTRQSSQKPGSIAGFLQPAENSSSQNFKSLMQIQELLPLTTGLQVVNIAVSAVGFAIVCKKLEKIEQKLDKINNNIKKIREEIKYLSEEVNEKFSSLEKRHNDELVATIKGIQKGVLLCLDNDCPLESPIVIEINKGISQLQTAFARCVKLGHLEDGSEMLFGIANLYDVLALAFARHANLNKAIQITNEAAFEVGKYSRNLVKLLFGSWPSVYAILTPEILSIEERRLFKKQFKILLQIVYSKFDGDIENWLNCRYPINENFRCENLGKLNIPISLESDEGRYVFVDNLGPEKYWKRFNQGKARTINLAFKSISVAMMVERRRLILERFAESGINYQMFPSGTSWTDVF